VLAEECPGETKKTKTKKNEGILCLVAYKENVLLLEQRGPCVTVGHVL